MKVLLIPDKFKGSLTARQVVGALSYGIRRFNTKSTIFKVFASDGGDGFLDAIEHYISVERVEVDTIDPLGRPLKSYYLIDKKNDTAYIELAKASGLDLLSQSELKIMEASTLGSGIQIMDAINNGAKNLVVGLGGSATNDGGIGIAHALGFRFLDNKGNELEPKGKNLIHIAQIVKMDGSLWHNKAFMAVNDVSNPLVGQEGASTIYGPQKGANREQVQALDEGLRNLAERAKETLGRDYALLPGTGAAGGAGFGLKSFFNADFVSGVDFIFQLAELPEIFKNNRIDYIITGEGKIDAQTLQGKLIKGVMELGRKYQVPVIAVCGKLEVDSQEMKQHGLLEVLEIGKDASSLQYSMDNAAELIENAIYNYFENLRR
ncbi:glycerate kinase [Arenibacter amylolyticus]|uniref:glycerate kinase n=1 Tax=Arenibacter amylolyticus TaxID=1406873 RepID=UPI000A36B1A6|nr:glycerate kinase [Arenibacter amylolyticus]